jgi:hypothetical protein
MSDDFKKLHNLLCNMDLPEQKKTSNHFADLLWLDRNMWIRNSDHPNFTMADSLLKKLIRAARISNMQHRI